MKRVHIVVFGAIACLVLAAGPAVAAITVHTKVIDFKVRHKPGGGNQLRFSGKLVLDDDRNPPELPANAEECTENRFVDIQKEKSGGGWKSLGNLETNPDGEFTKDLAHKEGTFRAKIRKTTLPTKGPDDNKCSKTLSPEKGHHD